MEEKRARTLDRVLSVGTPERRSGGKNASRSMLGKKETHALWPERLRQILGYLRRLIPGCARLMRIQSERSLSAAEGSVFCFRLPGCCVISRPDFEGRCHRRSKSLQTWLRDPLAVEDSPPKVRPCEPFPAIEDKREFWIGIYVALLHRGKHLTLGPAPTVRKLCEPLWHMIMHRIMVHPEISLEAKPRKHMLMPLWRRRTACTAVAGISRPQLESTPQTLGSRQNRMAEQIPLVSSSQIRRHGHGL